MANDAVRPALLVDEWRAGWAAGAGLDGSDARFYGSGLKVGYDSDCASGTLTRPHAIAALALYDQPYGFTREDLTAIREGIFGIQGRCSDMCSGGCTCRDDQARLQSVHDRIAALLPPESE